MSNRPKVLRPPRTFNHCNQIDTHEILKSEITRQGTNYETRGFTSDAPSDPLLRSITAGSGGPIASTSMPIITTDDFGFEENMLYFDSVFRDRSSDYVNGELRFSIAGLNNNRGVSNCVAIHLGSFYFPKIVVASTIPEFFYFQRVYMEIVSVSSTQAILGPSGQRFHFEFQISQLSGQAVILTPIEDTFYFTMPINDMPDFQLRFMVPQTNRTLTSMKRIPIPNETVNLVSVGAFNPIRFQITSGDTTGVLGLVGALVPTVAVFINGYTSNDVTVNALVNSQNGVFVSTILSTSTFEISGIDGTTVVGAFTAVMYIPKNRIAFPARFTSLQANLTNRVTVSHD